MASSYKTNTIITISIHKCVRMERVKRERDKLVESMLSQYLGGRWRKFIPVKKKFIEKKNQHLYTLSSKMEATSIYLKPVTLENI